VYFNRMYLERVPMASKKEIKEEYSKYMKEYDKMYGGEAESQSVLSIIYNYNVLKYKVIAGVVLGIMWYETACGRETIPRAALATTGVYFFSRAFGGKKGDFVSEYMEKMKGVNWDKNDYFIEGLKSLSKELKMDKNKIGIREKEGMEISKEIEKIVKSGRDIMRKVCILLTRREYGVLTVGELSDMIDEINEDKKLQKELERIL
jgi:hypothetical protein